MWNQMWYSDLSPPYISKIMTIIVSQLQNSVMNRDEIIDLTMANLLDIIPLISNIDNDINADINAALVSIYERNMDILNAIY